MNRAAPCLLALFKPGVLSPLIERELRAGARRPSFAWMRCVLALAAGFQACELLERHTVAPLPNAPVLMAAGPGPAMTGAAVLHEMSWLLFLATLLMGLLTADSITRERREGTLGFLLLTDLTPAQIVYGKMLSCGLTSFLALLGCLPALMLPVLAGGVTGSQAALTGIALLNTLFVSLTAGLWMSTLFRARAHAIAATLGLVAALAFGPQLLGTTILGRAALPTFQLFGLAGWAAVAPLPPLRNPLFIGWFAATHTLGWLLLRRAAATLKATWQDQPLKHFREPEPTEEGAAPALAEAATGDRTAGPQRAAVLPRSSWLTDPRPWDADPIRWRVERLGSVEGLVWLAMALNFFAQFGTLGSIFPKSAAGVDSWGLLSFVGMVVILFSGGLLAWAGARFFQDARRQQDFELLLTTPLGGRNILAGQWQILRRALAGPVGLILLLALPSGLSLLYDYLNGYGTDWTLVQPFLIAVNLVLEAFTLCWVGMWFGLRGRNPMTAVTGTVGLVQLLPLAAAVALTWAWVWLPYIASPHAVARGRMPPVILALLFLVGKNAALILWVQSGLRRELRLGARSVRAGGFTRCLVPQRA